VSTPPIRLRGIRASIPGGFILGRKRGAPVGDVQLLGLAELGALGVASSAQVAAAALIGFSFFEEGLMLAGELIGQGSWAHEVRFLTGGTNNFLCTSQATGSAAFQIKMSVSGIPTVVGTITFTPGSYVGVLAWTVSPTIFPIGAIIQLYAPVAADATLAGCSGQAIGGV